ncbi:MAG TPA: hypothetical protein PKK00_00175 [Bacteroidales bacterium]|nr:hypothetical protein [Bacteroidales bacterium]HPS16267.1 hypothetical protein [Bacteroidales bacterium]
MTNEERIIGYYSDLCNALNDNGYKRKGITDGKPYELDFQVEYLQPSLTMMSIARNIDAYQFLTQKELLKRDICHFCGETPIDDSYTFTEPINHITINICYNCHHNRGASKKTKNKGCMLLILIPIILIAASIFIFNL